MLNRLPVVLSGARRRVLGAVLLAASCLAAVPAAAQQTPPAQERIHVVQRGETLWDIARYYLGDPFLWPEIFRLNADVVQDPARIEPNTRLRIPGFAEGVAVEAPEQPLGPGGDNLLRFAERAARPVVSRGDYYGAALLVEPTAFAPVGKVAALEEPSVMPRRMPGQIQLYDRIFIPLGSGNTAAVGDRLHLFRRTARRVVPHGWVYLSTGVAEVAAVEDGTASGIVVQMYDVINVGDIAVPMAPFPVATGVLPAPADGLQGEVLAFQSQHPLQSVKDAVFVNLGQNSGVREGDEFVAFLPKVQERWGVRPAVDVARLRVVRVADRTATARIISIEYPAVQVGMPVRLVAKMP